MLIGDFIIYLFGRKYGRMAVHHRWFQKFLSPERLVMLEDKFKKKGVYVILFGRQLIGVTVQIILIAGIMRMDIVKFFWANAITVTLRIAVMGSIGYAGGHNLEEIGIDVSKITYVATFLLISCFIGYFFSDTLEVKEGTDFIHEVCSEKSFLKVAKSKSAKILYISVGN